MHLPVRAPLLAFALVLGLAGCHASPSIVGTWQGRPGTNEAPFTFGAVTFAPDGTFTAEARYGETVRAVSGRWRVAEGVITLEAKDVPSRSYRIDRTDGEAVFTDPASGRSITLDRFE